MKAILDLLETKEVAEIIKVINSGLIKDASFKIKSNLKDHYISLEICEEYNDAVLIGLYEDYCPNDMIADMKVSMLNIDSEDSLLDAIKVGAIEMINKYKKVSDCLLYGSSYYTYMKMFDLTPLEALAIEADDKCKEFCLQIIAEDKKDLITQSETLNMTSISDIINPALMRAIFK
tara:strand:- start:233 stop:760 length:528 start_codon:yes stop_codon:yes gene_type:complete